MAADHLVVNALDDVGDVEVARLGGKLRVEHDLEQKIAQFAGEFGRDARVESVEDFVGLFDKIGAQRFVGLLAVPGAAVWRPKPRLERYQIVEKLPGLALAAQFFLPCGR